jgi:CspA family cold shock protein
MEVGVQGRVKWFNDAKGYGFIQVPDVEGDVFVHFSEIIAEGFRTLREGAHVQFTLASHGRGFMAKDVTQVVEHDRRDVSCG